jgi:hypothetical protein
VVQSSRRVPSTGEGSGGDQAGGRARVRPRLQPPGTAGRGRRPGLRHGRGARRRRPPGRLRPGAGPPGRDRHRRGPPGRPPRPAGLRPGPARPGGRRPARRGLPGRVHAHPRPVVRARLPRPDRQHPPQPAAGLPGGPRRPRRPRLRGQGHRLHRPPGRRGGRPRPGAVPGPGPGRARRRRGPPPPADQGRGAPAAARWPSACSPRAGSRSRAAGPGSPTPRRLPDDPSRPCGDPPGHGQRVRQVRPGRARRGAGRRRDRGRLHRLDRRRPRGPRPGRDPGRGADRLR